MADDDGKAKTDPYGALGYRVPGETYLGPDATMAWSPGVGWVMKKAPAPQPPPAMAGPKKGIDSSTKGSAADLMMQAAAEAIDTSAAARVVDLMVKAIEKRPVEPKPPKSAPPSQPRPPASAPPSQPKPPTSTPPSSSGGSASSATQIICTLRDIRQFFNDEKGAGKGPKPFLPEGAELLRGIRCQSCGQTYKEIQVRPNRVACRICAMRKEYLTTLEEDTDENEDTDKERPTKRSKEGAGSSSSTQ